jgi:hypothetical protein
LCGPLKGVHHDRPRPAKSAPAGQIFGLRQASGTTVPFQDTQNDFDQGAVTVRVRRRRFLSADLGHRMPECMEGKTMIIKARVSRVRVDKWPDKKKGGERSQTVLVLADVSPESDYRFDSTVDFNLPEDAKVPVVDSVLDIGINNFEVGFGNRLRLKGVIIPAKKV